MPGYGARQNAFARKAVRRGVIVACLKLTDANTHSSKCRMKNLLSSSSIIACFTLSITCQFASAQNAEEKKEPVTQAMALKLGIDKLTKYTDESEAGQDQAASLYATAKRIETEHALAQKNLELVTTLDEWRLMITNCRQGSIGLAGIISGGGTMYSHGAARDSAAVEDFLSTLAKRLPIADGKGDAKAVKQMDDAVAFLKKLKPADLGDSKANKAAKADLAAEVKRVIEHWDGLKFMITEIPAEDSKKIATFVVGCLSWLKEEESK
jgi:hypothetical protein